MTNGRRANAAYINEVHSKGKVYFYLRLPDTGFNGMRIRADDRAEAERMARAITGPNQPSQATISEWRRLDNLKALLVIALKGARKRAAERRIDFALDLQLLVVLAHSQDWRCAISGIPFEIESTIGKDVGREPFRPSVDRIDRRRGYVPDNIRLTCVAVNFAINAWGDEVFFHVVDEVAKRRRENEDGSMLAKHGRVAPAKPIFGELLIPAES